MAKTNTLTKPAEAAGSDIPKQFEKRINTFSLFNASNTDKHTYWGKMLDESGQELNIQLFERKKDELTFYVGYALSDLKILKQKTEIDTNDPSSLILFVQADVTEENKRPIMTGSYKNEFGKSFRLAAWKRISQKEAVYFSGVVSEPLSAGQNGSDYSDINPPQDN